MNNRKFIKNIKFFQYILSWDEEKQMYCHYILDVDNQKIIGTVYFEDQELAERLVLCEHEYMEIE